MVLNADSANGRHALKCKGGGVLHMALCDWLSDGLDERDVGEMSHDFHCDDDLSVPFPYHG